MLLFFYAEQYLSVWLLPVVSLPSTFGQFHVGEYSLERRLFGRAGVDAKTYLTSTLMHVADAHLREVFSVL